MKTIYYFTADWCEPCKQTRPIVKEINDQQTSIKFKLINVDDNHDLVKRFDIKTIPTFILLENEMELKRLIGKQERKDLEKFAGIIDV